METQKSNRNENLWGWSSLGCRTSRAGEHLRLQFCETQMLRQLHVRIHYGMSYLAFEACVGLQTDLCM